jgi:adhesin/invasin
MQFYSVKGVLSAASRNAAAVMATAYTDATGVATTTLTDVSTSTTNMTDSLRIDVAAPGTALTASVVTGNTLTITYSATGAYSTLTLTGGTTATVTQTRGIESTSANALEEVGITPSLKDSAALAVTGVGITYTGSDGVYFRKTSGTRPATGDVKTLTSGSDTQIFAFGTKPGVATITATGGGLTATATFTVSAAPVAAARTLSAVAAAGRVTGTVKDGWGNPVAGVTVTFASDDKGIFGNGTSSTSAVTDANGLASALVQSADATGGDVSVVSTISGGQTASIAGADVKDFAAGVATVTTVAKPTAGAAGTDTAITGVKTDVTAVKADVATANAAVKALATQVTVLQASVATLIDSLTTQIASLMKSVSALTKAVAKLQKK